MSDHEVPAAAVEIVRRFEGVRRTPYLDPVGIWTVGVGHAIREGGRFLRGEADRPRVHALYPHPLKDAEVDALLAEDLRDAMTDVLWAIDVPLTENQLAALISLAFNIGASAFTQSTLRRLLNAGHYAGAASQFGRWTRARGKVLPGLVARRQAERELFEKPNA